MKQSHINLIFSSERKKDLLLFLKNGPKDIEIIKTKLKVDASTIQPHIKKMIDYDLIAQEDELYRLSRKGEIIVENGNPCSIRLKSSRESSITGRLII